MTNDTSYHVNVEVIEDPNLTTNDHSEVWEIWNRPIDEIRLFKGEYQLTWDLPNGEMRIEKLNEDGVPERTIERMYVRDIQSSFFAKASEDLS